MGLVTTLINTGLAVLLIVSAVLHSHPTGAEAVDDAINASGCCPKRLLSGLMQLLMTNILVSICTATILTIPAPQHIVFLLHCVSKVAELGLRPAASRSGSNVHHSGSGGVRCSGSGSGSVSELRSIVSIVSRSDFRFLA
ncbi:hypothetical protein F5B21DRAFT_282281 [Xylaria acuta]|nr:hypothetical protein F5B21DRAFT_282281 [Xylaria acuta]